MSKCKHEGVARWEGLGWFVYCRHCKRDKFVTNPENSKAWMRKAIEKERRKG